jgi:hypothetical protein
MGHFTSARTENHSYSRLKGNMARFRQFTCRYGANRLTFTDLLQTLDLRFHANDRADHLALQRHREAGSAWVWCTRLRTPSLVGLSP